MQLRTRLANLSSTFWQLGGGAFGGISGHLPGCGKCLLKPLLLVAGPVLLRRIFFVEEV